MRHVVLQGGPKHGRREKITDDTWGLEYWDEDGTWSYYLQEKDDEDCFSLVETRHKGL